jgi:hypothetical protein
VRSTLAGLPLAADKIVFDRFHIMKQMNHASEQGGGHAQDADRQRGELLPAPHHQLRRRRAQQ